MKSDCNNVRNIQFLENHSFEPSILTSVAIIFIYNVNLSVSFKESAVVFSVLQKRESIEINQSEAVLS